MKFGNLYVGERFIERVRRTDRDRRGIKVCFTKTGEKSARSLLTGGVSSFSPRDQVQRIAG